MSIISYFEEIVKYAQTRSLRIYLVLVNVLLVVFGIWFANVKLLPFINLSDFVVFVGLGFLFAIYRPGWAFLFFIGTIVLENINLAPEILGVALRPYQFFAGLTIGALVVRFVQKKSPVRFPKMNWADWAVTIFAISGFLSAVFAVEKTASFKQALVAFSFVAIYFLVRTFIQSFSDIKKILPFFLSSSLVVSIYGIWQNVRFADNLSSFEVMPGRPNATFTEADWLGIFIVFLLAVIFSIIFYQSKQVRISNLEFRILNQFSISEFLNRNTLLLITSYGLLVTAFIVLIITVARSAWLGAGIVTIGFLKVILIDGEWKIRNWKWKESGYAFLGVLASVVIALGIVGLFNLTSFELGNRAQSTSSGAQEITISCEKENQEVPQMIMNVSELANFGCRHINLEEIESEKESGNFVTTVFRPDPNVGVRADIYRKSVSEIRNKPVFGIGWGSIGKMLGTDERGAFFNTSNIFLEVWLGAGILGFISLMFVFGYILTKTGIIFYKGFGEERIFSVFSALGLFAILIPNLFNAGIFLGFLWVYLGIAVGMLNENKYE